MIEQEKVFEVEGDDGRLVKVTVRPPNPAVRLQVTRATRRAYCEAIRAGHRKEEQATADDGRLLADDDECGQLRRRLSFGEEQLARDDLPLAERLDVALKMRDDRRRLEMAANESAARKPTAEAVAAQAQFEALLVYCVYGPDGRRLFRSPDDYRNRSRAGEPFSYRVAQAVWRALYGLQPVEAAEEQFLRGHQLAS